LPIEVKFAQLKSPKIPSGLQSFIKKYRPEKALVVNLSLDKKVKLGKTKVLFLPYHRLLQQGPTFI